MLGCLHEVQMCGDPLREAEMHVTLGARSETQVTAWGEVWRLVW